jgi:hypothetical protein
MLRSMLRRHSSPTILALTLRSDLSSKRPSGLSSAVWKAGSSRPRISSRAFPMRGNATGPTSFETYLKIKAHLALKRPKSLSMPARDRSAPSLAVFGLWPDAAARPRRIRARRARRVAASPMSLAPQTSARLLGGSRRPRT